MRQKIFHETLQERWHEFSIFEQMANIGAEIGRTMKWRDRNKQNMSKNAFYRALELVDFTMKDPKNIGRLSEIARMREALVDYFLYDNIYNSTDEQWEKYFYQFNYAARRDKG